MSAMAGAKPSAASPCGPRWQTMKAPVARLALRGQCCLGGLVRQAEAFCHRFVGDLAPMNIQPVAQMRIAPDSCKSLRRERKTEPQGGVIERMARGDRDGARHVGDAIMNDAVDLVSRIVVSRRVGRLKAAALVDRHVYDHRTWLHVLQHG